MKIVERPAVAVVGMLIETSPGSADIPALWPKFVARMPEIDNPREPKVSYGVMWHGAAMEVLCYMAAASVAAPWRVPRGMTALTLPAGTYASFSYPLAELLEGFGEIFERLLPSSGYVQVPAPFFERYDEAFDPGDSSSRVEICLPVKKGKAPV